MLQSLISSCIKYERRAISCCLLFLLLLMQCQQSASLIVPNELPSILSLVYSNIPPIKKGTDSRLGFGFRLGEHADFQVLLELGPQKETRPIGDTEDSDGSSFNKRQVDKRQQNKAQHESKRGESSTTTWLEKWSNDVQSTKKKVLSTHNKFANKPADIPIAMPQLPEQTLKQLHMLYKMATSSTPANTLPSLENTQTEEEISAVARLQEKLKPLKAPANVDELQVLLQKPSGKTKTELTKELMDVSLDK